MFIFLDIARLIQEPLRSECSSISPVVTLNRRVTRVLCHCTVWQYLEYFCHLRLDESVGRDGDSIDSEVFVAHMLDSIGNDVGIPGTYYQIN